MDIPPEATCVFKGRYFHIYQWMQPMFDGSKALYERIKRPETVQIIPVTKNQTILIGRQEQPLISPHYNFFGGLVEDTENPLEGAKRELLEESGYASADWEHFITINPWYSVDWHHHVFIARNCQKVATQQLDAGEKIQVIECTWHGFWDMLLLESFKGSYLVMALLRLKEDRDKLEDFKTKLLIR